MNFPASLRNTSIHCKFTNINSSFLEDLKSIHVKNINDASSNKRESPDSLNIQDFKNFLNFWLFAILLVLNQLFSPYLVVPYTSIKTLAINFWKIKRGRILNIQKTRAFCIILLSVLLTYFNFFAVIT